MFTIRARSYENGEPIRVRIEGDRIRSVEPAWPDGRIDDWPYVAPGLFDMQINGHSGIWFSDATLTPEGVLKVLERYPQFGVTRLCPTLITNSFESLAAGFSAIRKACERQSWADRMVCGCHLEGPYISSEDGPRGAHPRQHVRPADWNEFQKLQELSGNRIRLVTIAPENPGAIEFIRRAIANRIVVSIGHTGASPEQIREAVDAGASLSTHLGNGSHAMIHRHRNYIFEQLSDPRLMVSLIVDGHHIPESLVRTFIRVKSPQRTVMTCDASGWAGCAPGIYENELGRSELLESGKLVVAGQREMLSGSAQETDVCVMNAMEFAGVGLKQAVDMTSGNVAKMLGFEPVRLRRGSLADLVVFKMSTERNRFEVEATIASGQLMYGEIISR
ncbi:MAG: amidohydrolase family protein [Planctomycetes bacterium]|nr:amidohydrolase family protein [Planctomycetota bacterium]